MRNRKERRNGTKYEKGREVVMDWSKVYEGTDLERIREIALGRKSRHKTIWK